MDFDDKLAACIRDTLARKHGVEEKMFGCVCFHIYGNALAGVWKDRLIARLGPGEGGRRCLSRTSGRSTSPAAHAELGGGRAGWRRGQ